MFFANMMEEKGIGTFRRLKVKGKTASTFVNELEDNGIDEGGIIADGKCLRVIASNNEATKSLLGKLVDPLNDSTEEELADTPQNPLIWVLTDEVTFLCGTSNLFKMISVNEDMFLFCLVKGACGIGADKTMLLRCIPSIMERESISYKAKDLYTLCGAKDKESGYNMTYDCVNYMRITLSRDGASVKTKTFADYSVILSEEGFKKERERIVEAKRREEERRKAQEEARRLAEAKAKAQQLEEERRIDEADIPVSAKVRKPITEEVYSEPTSRTEICTGAAAFMQFINKKKMEG